MSPLGPWTTPSLCLAIGVAITSVGATSPARADEEYARRTLQAMSDYLASEQRIAFDFDTTFEVVSADGQKLALTQSGAATMERPDRLHVRRQGGFADMEVLFDGALLTILGHNLNLYTQIELPGSIDTLIDELRDTYGRPLPGADLLVGDVYGTLMPDVIDVKDLGAGVVGGVMCDHFAFRTEEVDWQIWIADGDRPYPCLYVITSKMVTAAPQYTVRVSNWRTGDEVPTADFAFANTTGAERIEFDVLPRADLPEHFTLENAQ
jgi:hypothetical protein